jgi:hypothetical protein
MSALKFPTLEQVIEAARSQVGTTEHPAGSNNTPYGKAYGHDGWAWCGIFVWWAFNTAGVDLRGNGIAHPQFTPSFWAEAKKAGWVVAADADVQPGDVLFFDFVAPFNTAGIQHTGFATARPHGGSVATVEGNTSSGPGGSQDNGGGVFERDRSLAYVVAAVRPPYSATAPKRAAKKATIHGPVKYGDTDATTSGSVSVIQHRLDRQLGVRVDVDGDYGRATQREVTAWQKKHRLAQDGVVGPNTAASLGFSYAAK